MADRFRPGFRITEHTSDTERDAADELAFHLAMRERELMEGGMSPEAARLEAARAFGDAGRVRAELRRVDRALARRRRWALWWGSVRQDLAHGLRGLRRNPLFALIAVLTLALGMGGNVVVFALVESVLLRPPPVAEPDRLASIWTTCRRGNPRCASSWPDFEDYRDRSTQFADVAAYSGAGLTLDTGGGPEVLTAEQVSSNYFTVLGLRPAAGRLFQPEEDTRQNDPALVVLSHALWRSAFGAEPGTIGTTVRVNGIPHVVVGVAPAGFEGLVLGQSVDFWTPLRGLPLLEERGAELLAARDSRWIPGVVGRLAPGATLERARAEMLAISDQLAQEDPEARGPRSVTVDALGQRVGGSSAAMASFLGILQGVVILTLLLACANLANLLLARASARRVEVGVRLALGVGRARLARQMLTESLLIAGIGAVVALALAVVALRLLSGVALPQGIEIGSIDASMNGTVLAFVLVLTLLTGLVFGGMPAFTATRGDVGSVLREARGGDAGGSVRLRSFLIGVQIALGVLLLVGAGLFTGTLRNRLDVDLGFPPGGLALVTVDASLDGLAPGRDAGLADRLEAAIRNVQGVRAVGAGVSVPIAPGGNATFVTVDGYVAAPDEEMRVEFSVVTAGYLRALGLPVVEGRDFRSVDRTTRAVLIDETMAARWWNGRSAVGGTVHFRETPFTVLGVVRRTAWNGLDVGNTPFVYIGTRDDAPLTGRFTLLVRTDRDAAALLPAVREAIRSVEPALAIRDMDTMVNEVGRWLAPQRTAAWLLSGFGLLALALAAMGIYGVISYTISMRRRDLSLRIVLGASGRGIVTHVARGMLVPAAAGLGAGLVSARLLSGTVERFMFGVRPTDPGIYAAVAVMLALVTMAATLLPAARAAALSPAEAIRAD